MFKSLLWATLISLSNLALANERIVTVKFATKVTDELPVEFEALTKEVKVKVGERNKLNFKFKNLTTKDLPIITTHGVEPLEATASFKKFVCFCFSEQTLKAKKEVVMPLEFKITEDLPKDIQTIVVAYNLYEKRDADIKPMKTAKHDTEQDQKTTKKHPH